MKIHRFKKLQRDIAEKTAHLEMQRESIKFERTMLKKVWIDTLTSPSALLLSLSIGFVAGYFRKSKIIAHGKISKVRANLQSAIINAIKRFSSGIVIGIVSSITSRRSGLAIAPQED